MSALVTRLRRLRGHAQLRALLTQTWLNTKDLVQPLFVCEGHSIRQPIQALPGQYQLSIDQLAEAAEQLVSLGIPAVLLFGVLPSHKKDPLGQYACDNNGLIQKAINVIKHTAPELLVIADVCFCEYTDHGHCGVVVQEEGGSFYIDNDKTLALLAKQAVSLARAGADVIAPSGMMDGMVQAIRTALDQAHFVQLPILSYAVKYASAFYEPFREAAQGAPQFGNRLTYQMNPAASRGEALREAQLDIAEGADMLMVKPGHTYLDIIYQLKQQYPAVPVAAYHVSGEYAMLKAALEKGWLPNERQVVIEVMTALKRAGADFIITYYARDIAQWLQHEQS